MSRKSIIVHGDINPAIIVKYFFLNMNKDKNISLTRTKNNNWRLSPTAFSSEKTITLTEREYAELLADLSREIITSIKEGS